MAHDRFGLPTVFHPHAETHVEDEDQIERFLEQTDPARVSLCLDTGHHAYRGGDPVAFMRRHHDRIHYLHLKSIDREIQKKVEREKLPYSKAVVMNMFCEPSQGAVDFPAFRDVLREINYDGWATVEQDIYPRRSTSRSRSQNERANICETSALAERPNCARSLATSSVPDADSQALRRPGIMAVLNRTSSLPVNDRARRFTHHTLLNWPKRVHTLRLFLTVFTVFAIGAASSPTTLRPRVSQPLGWSG